MTHDKKHWETFVCTSCGDETSRLRGSFDFPVCCECRIYDEIDPTGTLKRERMKGRKIELP